jgi:hypothetical protein
MSNSDHQDEVNHKIALVTEYKKQLRLLELKAVKFGLHVPTYIEIEIQDIKDKLSKIDESIYNNSLNPIHDKLLDSLISDADYTAKTEQISLNQDSSKDKVTYSRKRRRRNSISGVGIGQIISLIILLILGFIIDQYDLIPIIQKLFQ